MSIKSLKNKYLGRGIDEYGKGYSKKNITELDDYSEYKVKFYRAVPPNTKLVCRNRFTGNITIKNSGFNITMPWIESKFVSVASRAIDYPKEKYKTKDGIELEIDIAIPISIVDPYKYETQSVDPLKELGIATRDILRVFVANKTEAELVGKKHTKADVDSGNIYATFEEKYGIKVNDIHFKSIDLPQSLKDDFEKKLVQERENERAKAEAHARKLIAEIEADIKKIEMKATTEAIAERAEKYLEAIDKDKKLSPLEKKHFLEVLLVTLSESHIVTSINSGMTPDDELKYLIGNNGDAKSSPRR